jgi:hypothetical protein
VHLITRTEVGRPSRRRVIALLTCIYFSIFLFLFYVNVKKLDSLFEW